MTHPIEQLTGKNKTGSFHPLGLLASMRENLRGIPVGGVLVALVLMMPTLVIAAYIALPTDEVFDHIAETVLADYVINSLVLMMGVGAGALVLGLSTAWLVTVYDFPLKRLFEWALLLPLAMPAYIIAYTYTGLLDFAGPVQQYIRAVTGWGYGDYYFPEIRSIGGAIVMLSLVLYPYVYMMARAAFLSQSTAILNVSRSLGQSPWYSFWRVALPMARPAIMVGLALVLMETLADYGTVDYFGVPTFTIGIFRTWYGLDSLTTAAQLATLLLVFVILLYSLEHLSRRGATYHKTSQKDQAITPRPLQGKGRYLAVFICSFAVGLGFLLPALQLLYWTLFMAGDFAGGDFWRLTGNSLLLGSITAVICVWLALFMGYINRQSRSPLTRIITSLSTLGYAIPGTVIAVGTLIFLASTENAIDGFMRQYFDLSTGLIFSGTLVALIFAYVVRFFAAGFGAVQSGFTGIKPSMDDAARSLGRKPASLVWSIHMPLLKGSLLTACLIVFVDVMKELPATLILRPFNFNTLAVRAYEMAGDEQLVLAAPPALMIVAAGIIPVILLSRAITNTREIASND